jgi:hypothetical protein
MLLKLIPLLFAALPLACANDVVPQDATMQRFRHDAIACGLSAGQQQHLLRASTLPGPEHRADPLALSLSLSLACAAAKFMDY